jgi:3-methyladenine DNA glycosylase/8-oxoguanine DNA glycosylase
MPGFSVIFQLAFSFLVSNGSLTVLMALVTLFRIMVTLYQNTATSLFQTIVEAVVTQCSQFPTAASASKRLEKFVELIQLRKYDYQVRLLKEC